MGCKAGKAAGCLAARLAAWLPCWRGVACAEVRRGAARGGARPGTATARCGALYWNITLLPWLQPERLLRTLLLVKT